MSIFKSNKCQICKIRRFQRFCLRRGKDICWQCCNNIRIDQKCPNECEYCLSDQNSLRIKTKVDSTTEYRDLVRKLFDRWALLPQDDFDNQIPVELAKSENGKAKLSEYFRSFDLENFPEAQYILNKFNLKDIEVTKHSETAEDVAFNIMKRLLIKDYDSLLNLYYYRDELSGSDDFKKDFFDAFKNDKVLKKLKEFNLISAAKSENNQEVLVYFDLNGKYDLTLRLKIIDSKWFFWQRIMGQMQIVNGEYEACSQVGALMAQKQLGRSFELMEKYLAIYPDSSNMNYLKGIYEKLHTREDSARKFFLRAVRLDPLFTDARINYASQLFLANQKEKALAQLLKADKLNNRDVKVKNNIAVIYLEKEDYQQAEKFLNECLDIDKAYEPAVKNINRLNEIKKSL